MTPAGHPFDDAMLLDIWEQGQPSAPMVRTNLLLAAALPESGEATRAALPVSAADLALLRLHRSVFGSRLPAETICPACASPLEFDLDAGTLIDGLAGSPPDADGRCHGVREPTVGDLETIAALPDLDAAICRLASLYRLDPRTFPSDADIAEIDALYGQSAIRLRLDCVGCGHAWHEDFDIVGYLWLEVEQRAQTLIDDIHALAMAYGWSEPQILALTDARRGRVPAAVRRMSLYLQRLVVRARAAQPAIRPRKPPRLPPVEAPAPDQPEPAPSRRATEQPERTQIRRAAAAAPWTESASAETRPEPFPSATPVPPPAHRSRTPEPRLLNMPQTALPPASAGAVLLPTATIPSEGTARGLPPAAPPDPDNAPAPSGAPDQTPPPATPPVIAAIPQPAEGPHSAPRMAKPEQPSGPAEEPGQITYIHIGHVELHAAPPAVTIQRPPQSPPRISTCRWTNTCAGATTARNEQRARYRRRHCRAQGSA